MTSIIQFTYTTLMLIGLCALGVTGRIESVTTYRDALVVQPTIQSAFAVGGMIVTSVPPSYPGYTELLKHEYGHLIQEREYGPLYLLLVALPSVVGAWTSWEWAPAIETLATELGGG